jgi:hypothetical protein
VCVCVCVRVRVYVYVYVVRVCAMPPGWIPSGLEERGDDTGNNNNNNLHQLSSFSSRIFTPRGLCSWRVPAQRPHRHGRASPPRTQLFGRERRGGLTCRLDRVALILSSVWRGRLHERRNAGVCLRPVPDGGLVYVHIAVACGGRRERRCLAASWPRLRPSVRPLWHAQRRRSPRAKPPWRRA